MRFRYSKLWYFWKNVQEKTFVGEKDAFEFKITADWFEQEGTKIHGKFFYIVHDGRLKKFRYLGHSQNTRQVTICRMSFFGRLFWELQKNLLK